MFTSQVVLVLVLVLLIYKVYQQAIVFTVVGLLQRYGIR